MPIEYDIIENKKLVLARGSGVLNSRDIINHLEALANDNRYVPPMKKLIDYRLVENIILSIDEAWQIADKKKALSTIFVGEKCAMDPKVRAVVHCDHFFN